MDEGIAQQRPHRKAHQERRQPADSRLAHGERRDPHQRDEADQADASQAQEPDVHVRSRETGVVSSCARIEPPERLRTAFRDPGGRRGGRRVCPRLAGIRRRRP